MAKKTVVKKKRTAKKIASPLARAPKGKVLPENGVVIPRPAKKSYNAKRSLERNALLANQVKHFHEVEKQLPPRQRSGIAIEKIKTEGQAAKFIRHVTLRLHKQKKGDA